MTEGRKQPWSAEAEKAVLAGVLLNPEIAIEVYAMLTESDFYDNRHRRIYLQAKTIDSRGEPVDLITVSNELERLGELEAAGGLEYIAAITDDLPFLSNVKSYCRIVKDSSQLRQYLSISSQGVERALSTNVNVSELLDDISQKLFDIGTSSSQKDFYRVSELTDEALQDFRTMRDAKDGVTGLSTGLEPLDRMTTGFHPGEMNVIAATPGVGKTSLAMNMARHIASLKKGIVVFFSLEMTALDLTKRLISSMAGVSTQAIVDGNLADSFYDDLDKAGRSLHELPIFIDDTPSISSAEIRAKTRRLAQKEQGSVAAVFVDYLQLMQGADDVENHQLRVAKNSADLKGLAKDLGIPVIVLSQLSREAAKRGAPPRLSDLRDSGAIEQDADLVMFLHDENANTGQQDDRAHGGLRRILLRIAKQRKGQRGDIKLIFNPSITTFYPDETQDDGF
ncbi:MAG: replicative DNA helicase [Candidatus Sabulitectum sp.]|nr:replicative DNA helicase [Candidatus Sabulitectum sp.]